MAFSNFPTPSQIIEDLNDLDPYIKPNGSREGEIEAGKYIADIAKKFGLGDVKHVPLPATQKFANYTHGNKDLGNIVIDAGEGTEEMLFLHGHYDVVPPNDYRGKPHKIVHGPDGELRGLGSYDMLPGVAAILTALRTMRIDRRRRVRAILVCGEENDSEGTHGAFDQSNNLFAFNGKRAALSTEITVGSTIKDPYHLVIGRPGRFTYDLMLEGVMKHAGEVRPSDTPQTVLQRLARAEAALMGLQFSRHPNDVDELLYPGQVAPEYATVERPGSLSTPKEGEARYNVHYANSKLTGADIQEMMRQAVRDALGDDNFLLGKTDRTVPWLRPWLEPTTDGSFARTMQAIASKEMSQLVGKQQHVGFRAGSGVADENIIGQEMTVVCVSPQGEGAHKAVERGNVRSVTEFQVPVIQAAAAHEGPLFGDGSPSA